MTCIVGIIADGHVYIGADSAATDEAWGQCELADSKVFVSGEFIIGAAGSIRAAQLVRYALHPPAIDSALDMMAYLIGPFVGTMREVLESGGCLKIKEGVESTDAHFLVGHRGRLFTIDEAWQVYESRMPYACIGNASDYALGAMFANARLTPKNRILQALEAAAEFNAGVRAPFVVEVV